MGGKAVMQFALENPEMVDKLIVVDIAPVQYSGRHHHIFQALFDLDLDSMKRRSDAEDFLKDRIPGEAERLFILKNLTRKKEGGFRLKMNLPVIHKHYSDILAAIENLDTFDGTTLFIKGAQSHHIEDSHFDTIRSLFPNVSFHTIENAGHWVHADAPDEFLRVALRFLTS